jgi:peptidoglycan/LPS O-acetylase OafA/YrhL
VLFIFWFAYDTRWTGFNRFGDYSYGVYLWGYPSQQIVASLYPDLPALANAAAGFVGAVCIAIASWHCIEKPALDLKTLPGRLLDRVKRKYRQSSGATDTASNAYVVGFLFARRMPGKSGKNLARQITERVSQTI